MADAPALDTAAGPGVVCGQGLFYVAAETIHLGAKIARPALEIGEGIVGIDAEFARGARHQLRQASRAHR